MRQCQQRLYGKGELEKGFEGRKSGSTPQVPWEEVPDISSSKGEGPELLRKQGSWMSGGELEE